MTIRYSERTPRPETVLYSVDFTCKKKTYIAFTCVNPPLFLLLLLFLLFYPLQEFNFDLNFNLVSLFH